MFEPLDRLDPRAPDIDQLRRIIDEDIALHAVLAVDESGIDICQFWDDALDELRLFVELFALGIGVEHAEVRHTVRSRAGTPLP